MNKNYYLLIAYLQVIKYYHNKYRNVLDNQKLYRESKKEEMKSYFKNYEIEFRKARDDIHHPNHLKAVHWHWKKMIRQKLYRKKNGLNHFYAENYRWRQIKKKYGLTKETYTNKILEQNNNCDLCGKELIPIEAREICVDHNHITNKVRGIIHSRCNKILGFASDDIELLKMAIEYLKKHS